MSRFKNRKTASRGYYDPGANPGTPNPMKKGGTTGERKIPKPEKETRQQRRARERRESKSRITSREHG
jgi:hypothetical protein